MSVHGFSLRVQNHVKWIPNGECFSEMTGWTLSLTILRDARKFVNSKRFPESFTIVWWKLYVPRLLNRCSRWIASQSHSKDNILPHGAVIYFQVDFRCYFIFFPVINFIGNEISGNFSTSTKKRCVFHFNSFLFFSVKCNQINCTFCWLSSSSCRIRFDIYCFRLTSYILH